MDATDLDKAIRRVAEHRVVVLAPLAELLDGLPELSQAKWSAWRGKQDFTDRVPAELSEVIATVSTFADPILERGSALTARSWDPVANRWLT